MAGTVAALGVGGKIADNLAKSAAEERSWRFEDMADVPFRSVGKHAVKVGQRHDILDSCRWEHSADRKFAAAEGSRDHELEEVWGYCAIVNSVLPLVDHEPSSLAGP